MADLTSFRKLAPRAYPPLPGRVTAEGRYWRRFKHPVLVKEYAGVTSVHFSPVKPHDFAVTSSTRVQIYSTQTNSVKKVVSRFADVAYSGTFRADGRLLVAGGEDGLVQVFDLGSRAVLRSFKGHESAVHVARFSHNKTQVVSCSDDRTVRLWSLEDDRELLCMRGHEDYIRTGFVSGDNPDLVVSGAYDHTVRLWDVRSGVCTMTLDHGSPVEKVLVFPGGGLLLSAGQNVVNVWDVLSGGRLVRTLSNHQKTITDMCFDAAHSRLLTASLDHHVKIYDVADYKVTHSLKYPAPLLSLALSPDDTHLVAGMSNGLLSIRRRTVHAAEQIQHKAARVIHGGSFRYYMRGQGRRASQSDYKVEERRKPRLRPYELLLKSFRYKDALDAVLKNQRPIVVMALLEELSHRDALRTAISGRDDIALEPLLTFLVRYVTNPRYAALLVDVTNIVLDLYTTVVGQSLIVDQLLAKLRQKLLQEVALQKQMLELIGGLDMLFALSSNRDGGTGFVAAYDGLDAPEDDGFAVDDVVSQDPALGEDGVGAGATDADGDDEEQDENDDEDDEDDFADDE